MEALFCVGRGGNGDHVGRYNDERGSVWFGVDGGATVGNEGRDNRGHGRGNGACDDGWQGGGETRRWGTRRWWAFQW